jgi:hypothetical protein
MMLQITGWLILLPVCLIQVVAADTVPSRLYEVTIETGMPHLEENLRYATTRSIHCLTQVKLSEAFPILTHPSLTGCRLDRRSEHGDTISYELICTGGHGTTGVAVWHLSEQQTGGTLNVKLGGKNMTFYQRVTAKPVGACRSEAPSLN